MTSTQLRAHLPADPASDKQPVLATSALVIARGRRTILSDVDLVLNAGEAVCVEGPNGSGKTSLLRVLAGLSAPRAGQLARSGQCAFVPEKVILSPAMRCREWLDAMRVVRGLSGIDWREAVTTSGLDERVLDVQCVTLSKGMLQRLALLEAMHADCAVVLLDEPFSGLDVEGREWLGQALRLCVAAGTSVLVTDHSGAARATLPLSAVYTLQHGRCSPGSMRGTEPLPAVVTVLATHTDGRRIERRASAQESDRMLSDLLAAGWHIEAVRR